MKQALIITGVLAWAGGMATMLASPSCDVECLPNEDTPSVVLSVSPEHGTRWDPAEHPVEVTYEIHSPSEPGMSWEDDKQPEQALREPVTVREAQCINADCTTWTLGADRPGRYEITAKVCGKEFKGRADVTTGEDGCHAETAFTDIQIDARSCDPPILKDPEPGPMCDAVPHPSVHLYIAKEMQDTLIGVNVDRVWFEVPERRIEGEGNCVTQETGVCDTWLIGRDLEGEITMHAEYCGKEFTETVTVEKDEGDCHVQTEFVLMKVDTVGCLKDNSPPIPDPTPPPNELPH